jgi:hypothetical protein
MKRESSGITQEGIDHVAHLIGCYGPTYEEDIKKEKQLNKKKEAELRVKERLHRIFGEVKFAYDEGENHVLMLGELDVEDYIFLFKQDIFPNHAFKTTRRMKHDE